ncbi:hypothetical protein HMPREF0262_00823 [Clostridium sp. ATCC 29733]|nr:hypothetical protein HMPREF0262_00823 [Clostridium sp. ATCC 29733]
MLFVDEFCGILVYIKFGADVTSQCVDTAGKNAKKIAEYIQNQLKEDQVADQLTIKEYVDPFTGSR